MKKTILFLIITYLFIPFLYADHPKNFSEFNESYLWESEETGFTYEEYIKQEIDKYKQEHIDQQIKIANDYEKRILKEYTRDEKEVLEDVRRELHQTEIFFKEFNPVALNAIKKFRESGVLLEISLTLFQVKSDLEKAGFTSEESMNLISGTMKIMTSAIDKIKN